MNDSVVIGFASRGRDLSCKTMSFLVGNGRPAICSVNPFSAKEAQEKVFRNFLETKYDYLFMFDSDVLPPTDCIDRLLARDKDVIVAPAWHFDEGCNDIHVGLCPFPEGTGKRLHNITNKHGVERILGSSFSAILIKRHVLEKIATCFPTFFSHDAGCEELRGLFQTDMILFYKMAKLGIEAYVDWDIKNVEHNKYVTLSTEVMSNFVNKFNQEGEQDGKELDCGSSEEQGRVASLPTCTTRSEDS